MSALDFLANFSYDIHTFDVETVALDFIYRFGSEEWQFLMEQSRVEELCFEIGLRQGYLWYECEDWRMNGQYIAEIVEENGDDLMKARWKGIVVMSNYVMWCDGCDNEFSCNLELALKCFNLGE